MEAYKHVNITGNGTFNSFFSSSNARCDRIPVAQSSHYSTFKTGTFVCQIGFPFIFIHTIYILLRRAGQPFFVAEVTAAIVFSVLSPVKKLYTTSIDGLEFLLGHGLPVVGFMMGLDMSFSSFWTSDQGSFIMAATSIIPNMILSIACLFPYINHSKSIPESLLLAVLFGLLFSNVSSSVLTQISTDLKLIKTQIGRLAISSGFLSDLFTLLLVGFVVTLSTTFDSANHGPDGTALFILLIVISRGLIRSGVEWVNQRNPEGRRMKSGDLTGVGLLLLLAVLIGTAMGADVFYAAFLIGLAFHKEGRLVRELKSRCNAFCSFIVLPLLILKIGMRMDLGVMSTVKAWGMLLLLVALATVGKLMGTVVACSKLGIPTDEALALGFLLSIKGYIHLIVVERSLEFEIMKEGLYTEIILAILVTAVIAPALVMVIVRKARRTSPLPRMALQWMDPRLELRVLTCIHDARDVPSVVNVIEGLRGPTESTLLVYAMHLVELPDDVNTVLVYQEDEQCLQVVTSTEALEQQNQIATTFRAYEQHAGDGLVLRHMTTASSVTTMHEDVCNAAEDIRSALLILPFHRHQRFDGRMDIGNLGFQSVNRKILRHSPCSATVLVDRGLGGTSLLSATEVSHHVAALFIGGPDDREALALAVRLADHRAVSLTAVRFLPDVKSAPSSRTSSLAPFNIGPDSADSMAEAAKEAESDEEFMAAFTDRYVATGIVTYVEKYVSNGADTVARLVELESLYTLFVVGRGGHTASVVLKGMREWEEAPELGPIGDVLGASDFSATASVLVVQQHRHDNEVDAELM